MQVQKSAINLSIPPQYQPSFDYLAGRDEYIRRLLPQWCAICSGSGYAKGLAEMRAALLAAMSDLGKFAGLGAVGAEDKDCISIRCRPDAPFRVLFSGHYDTVFGPEDPFQVPRWLDDNVLNAPGCADMKGGLMVMLLALEAFEQYADKHAIGWEILITPDEETGSLNSVAAIRQAATRNHLGLVVEPALPDGRIVRNRKGTGRFEACVTGQAAHTGRDFSRGRNAIEALGRFISSIEALNKRYPDAVINTGWVEGGGPLNMVPAKATARFHIRVPDPGTYDRLNRDIMEQVAASNREDGISLTWRGELDRPPKIVAAEEERYFALLQDCARQFDYALDWGDTGGGSDGNILVAAGLPTLDGMGVRGGNLHSPEEFAHIDSVAERARFLTLFLLRLASTPNPA